METAKGERFSDLRLEQAIGVGAEVLATSCPYCISQFEDSRLTLKDNEVLQIKDITEILQEVIQEITEISRDDYTDFSYFQKISNRPNRSIICVIFYKDEVIESGKRIRKN